DAELMELPHNARRPPRWVGPPHVSDEVADFFGKSRPARLTALTEPSPVIAKSVFLPRDDGAGLHECQSMLPGRPQAGGPGPEESISRPELGPRDGVMIDGQLMPEGHVFEAQGLVRPEVRHDVSHQG